MAKETMAHAEKNETPAMEAKYHNRPFLQKALADKKSLTKGKEKSLKK